MQKRATTDIIMPHDLLDPETFPCAGCLRRLPRKEFMLVKGRPTKCKECYKRESQDELQDQLMAVVKKSFFTDVRTLSKAKIDVPHISELTAEMMGVFGGMQSFVRFYYEQVMQAAQEKPGSKPVLDACKAITNLVESSTLHRKSAPDVIEMSDVELEAEKAKLLIEMMVKDETGQVLKLLRDHLIASEGGEVAVSMPADPAIAESVDG